MDDPTTAGVAEGFGLMDFNARMYDPALGRFTSPDTLIPPGVQGYDRFAYGNNSPTLYTDPTGHDPSNNNCDYAGEDCEPKEEEELSCPEEGQHPIKDATLTPDYQSSPYSQALKSKAQIVGSAQTQDLIETGNQLKYDLFDPNGTQYYVKEQK